MLESFKPARLVKSDYQRAIYMVDVFGPAQLLVFRPGDRITIRAKTDAAS